MEDDRGMSWKKMLDNKYYENTWSAIAGRDELVSLSFPERVWERRGSKKLADFVYVDDVYIPIIWFWLITYKN